jgi:hypothetical protein
VTRQQELMAISDSKTEKRFRFYLQNASKGLLLLRFAPEGWKDSKFELKRNEKYMGLFRSISFNDLKWHKDSRDYIRDVYEGQGINAIIKFIVERLDDTTGSYLPYFTGKLDLSTYKIEETGVGCQVIDTSFAEKVKNRESVKVNIYDLFSIEGLEIYTFPYEDTRRLRIPASHLWLYAKYVRNDPYITTDKTHYVPIYLNSGSDFAETQSQSISGTDPFFLNSSANRNLILDGYVAGRVTNTEVHELIRITVNLYVGGVLNQSWNQSIGGTDELNFNIFVYKEFTISSTESAYLEAVVTIGYIDSGDTTIEYYNVSGQNTKIGLREIAYNLIPVWVKSWPIYETFWRVIQKITDQVICFHSTLFGRTDTPVDSYPVDGQLGHIAKGRLIKNAESGNSHTYISYPDTPAEISLQELFQSLNSVFCIGLGIEEIGGYTRVVIESLRYFFKDTICLDLSYRIREENINKEVIPTRHYAEVHTGYNSFEYLSLAGGTEEFNAKSNFSSVISVVDSLYDIISKYRGDTNGINLLRYKAGKAEDTKGEEDLFIIDSVRIESDPYWQARTDEGFSAVTGMPGTEDYFNLNLSPKRNLLRHGAVIRAGLEKNLGTYLRWQAADKNTELSTQLDSETEPVVENTDVLVDDLEEPFFIPELYTVDCVMNYADLTTILSNPTGLVKLSDTKYGWIMQLTVGSQENKAEIKLLRCNLNKVIPITGD